MSFVWIQGVLSRADTGRDPLSYRALSAMRYQRRVPDPSDAVLPMVFREPFVSGRLLLGRVCF